jgi:photosystem II stability/assembly factor-like uncharacterized protein
MNRWMNPRLPWLSRALLLSLAMTFLVSSLRAAAFAQPAAGSWTGFGPGGGDVSSLAVDPVHPARVYAATRELDSSPGTLYRSANGGQTWQALAGPGLGLVALDPAHPATVYAGGSILLRSADGGQTWSDVSPPLQGTRQLTTLAVTPGGIVLASDAGSGATRLLRSADGGQTWSVVLQTAGSLYQTIAVDPTAPARVYFTNGTAVYESADAGESWPLASSPGGSFASPIVAFGLAPSAPSTLYASGYGQIYRSDDGALTWLPVGTLQDSQPNALLVDPRLPGKVYGVSTRGIFTSTDGGETWMPTHRGLPQPGRAPLEMLSLAMASSQPGFLYAGTVGWGVARSARAGVGWRIGVETGLNDGFVELLKFHPSRPGTVYVGLDWKSPGDRSFRSTDGGRTWQPFARGLTQDGWTDLAFDPADADLLYAQTSAGISKSTDGGDTWVHISDQRGRIAALGRQTLLAADCGLAKSTDEGRTWNVKIPCETPDGNSARSLRSLWVNPKDLRNVYVQFDVHAPTHPSGPSQEVFRSQDGGTTWKVLALRAQVLEATSFAVSPGDSRVVYAVDDDLFARSLVRSMDGGESWTVVNRSLPSAFGSDGSLAVDSVDSRTLYVAATPLLISHDGGVTFKPINTPFEVGKRGADRVWTDRTQPGLIYAAGVDGGLFVGRFE